MASSLTEKLQLLRAQKETSNAADQMTEIKLMSLEELEKETIQFGKAKAGMKFAAAFEDHKWTDWFVSQYEKSDKTVHQKYITYVEKRLDQEISQSPSKVIKPKVNNNQKMGSEASWSHVKGEDLGSEASGEEVSHNIEQSLRMGNMEDQMCSLFEENQTLHQRMNGVEAALSELISHVKALKVAP